jgi:hypothetical protein
VFHLSIGLMIGVVAVLEPLTGGDTSPAHELVWAVVVYAALFFAPGPVVGYWAAAAAVSASQLLYDGNAVEGNLIRGCSSWCRSSPSSRRSSSPGAHGSPGCRTTPAGSSAIGGS